MMDRSTVVGVFDNRAEAERAIDELHRVGFRDDQIGFAWRGGDDVHHTTTDVAESHAGEGAVGGMLAGAGIGGLIAAAASLLIPGFGPVIAGGILATVLGGAAVGAAAGGILGALVGMGVPEEEAHYYESEFNEGRILVTVKADGRTQEARDVLYRFGAYDVEHRRGSTVGAGTTMGTSTVTHMDDWSTMSPTWHQRWQTHYGTTGGRWEDFEPGYRYGYEMAYDPRYSGREWRDVEPELRREWSTWGQSHGYHYGDSDWDRFRENIHESWDEARGRRRAA